MNRFLLAIQFLTIFPVRSERDFSSREISGSAVFFPAVGAGQGLLAVALAVLLLALLPVGVVSGLVLAFMIINNGGFHMDGLADTFDAFAVKSSGDAAADRTRRLAVMKDSSTGAIGVTAVVVVILLKYLLINNLLEQQQASARYALLFLAPVLSKWLLVQAMYRGRPARQDGLGRLFMDSISGKDAALSFVSAILFALIAGFFLHERHASTVALFFPAAFAALYLFQRSWQGLCSARFGGLTGDTLGAQGELSEIIYLLGAAAWLQRSI